MGQDTETVENTEKVDRGDDVTSTLDEIIKADEPAEVKEEVVEPKEEPKEEVKEEPTEPKKVDGSKFVPRERLNEAVAKERAKAEAIAARAAELEQQLAARTTSQDIEEAQKVIKTLIKQRNSHLGDGELDKASEVDSQIIELQEAIAERKAEMKFESSKQQAVETMKYDTIVERLENEHPELNPDSEEYDEELATEIRALMRGYQTELKLTPSQALLRAARRVFPATKKDADLDEKTAQEGVRRKQEAVARNVETAKKQPASTKEVGLDHDKKGGGLDAKTIMSMKYDEFVKIGDDVLSRLRGDSL